MWRSGITRRRQRTALLDMVRAAVDTGMVEAPWRADPDVLHFYADEGAVLRELQAEWRHALAGAVYVAIEVGDGDLAHDVRSAYEKVAKRLTGVRQILEANRDHPAIAAAMRKEQALLSSFVATSDFTPTGSPQAA
ncbi:hypothetical protein [Nocardioides caldifontis]|uniref:hypothetical protein n=1 Tax=Nocardioides caldifontis TaxID=2588938 RepID=UPI0011DF2A60|nr:hypothetical protein [Nocardioides caldifontis]